MSINKLLFHIDFNQVQKRIPLTPDKLMVFSSVVAPFNSARLRAVEPEAAGKTGRGGS